MYKTIFLVISIILLSPSQSFAQTVSAVSENNTQNSNTYLYISKLQDLIDDIDGKVDIVVSGVNQLKLCHDRKRIYDPDGYAPDADGCAKPGIRILGASKKNCSLYNCKCNSSQFMTATGGWVFKMKKIFMLPPIPKKGKPYLYCNGTTL